MSSNLPKNACRARNSEISDIPITESIYFFKIPSYSTDEPYQIEDKGISQKNVTSVNGL